MSGIWSHETPPVRPFVSVNFVTGPQPPPLTPQPGNIDQSKFESRQLRRVVIEDDYHIEHDTWGTAVLPKFRLTIHIDGEGPFPAFTTIPGPWYEPGFRDMKHTCPLTEAEPGTAMLYSCPVCSGVQC